GILETAPDGILMINSDGKILLVNTQIEQLFGYKRIELLDNYVEILIPDKFKDIHVKHRTSYFQHPSTRPMGINKELVDKLKNGTELPIEISLGPIVLNS